MVTQEQVSRSRTIQQRTGRTFHYATRLLPQRVRHPTYVLYAFFRLADEVVDAATELAPAAQRAELERLRAAALGDRETDDPVLSAFAELRVSHDIDPADVNAFVDAMVTDTRKSRYATHEELEAYMDGSAAAVGRMMTAVMNPTQYDRALPYASALGEAFQLTNFLRDVREDVVERDRIYFPASTLEAHGVTEDQVRECRMDDRFAAAMRDELHRTRRIYERGVAGIDLLPRDCRFPVLLAAVLYADHHRLVRRRGYDVLSATPQLSRRRIALSTARTRWHWALTGDPEAVFNAVSALPEGEETVRGGRTLGRWLPSR